MSELMRVLNLKIYLLIFSALSFPANAAVYTVCTAGCNATTMAGAYALATASADFIEIRGDIADEPLLVNKPIAGIRGDWRGRTWNATGDGAGRHTLEIGSSVTQPILISNLTLNHSSGNANAIFISGLGTGSNTVTLRNLYVSRASTTAGDAVFASPGPVAAGQLTIERCVINGGTAVGAALHVLGPGSAGGIHATNTLLSNASIGFFLEGASASSVARLHNCTLANNLIGIQYDSRGDYVNNIFAGNTLDLNAGGSASLLDHRSSSFQQQALTGTGTSNLAVTAAAEFVSAASQNYQLLPGALSRNSAQPLTFTADIQNDPRPSGASWDRGAYEYPEGNTAADCPAWTVNNGAALSAGGVTLTAALNNQRGSAWYDGRLDLTQPFDLTYKINFGNNASGADGVAFVLQDDARGPSALGQGGGGGLGYTGPNSPSPSAAFMLQTYTVNGVWNYMENGVNACGFVTSGTCGTPSSHSLKDGNFHLVRVTWVPGSNLLTFFVDGSQALQVTRNLATSVFSGRSSIRPGFSAATGLSNNLHAVYPLSCFTEPACPSLIGKSGTGADNVGFSGTVIVASPYFLPTTATLTQFRIRVLGVTGATPQVRAAVFSDNAGMPDTLLRQSGLVTAAAGLNTVDITDITLVAGTYWLAFQASDVTVHRDAVSPGNRNVGFAWGAFSSPFPGGSISSGNAYDIMADILCVPLTPTPTQSPSPTRSPTFSPSPSSSASPSPTASPTRTETPCSGGLVRDVCDSCSYLTISDALAAAAACDIIELRQDRTENVFLSQNIAEIRGDVPWRVWNGSGGGTGHTLSILSGLSRRLVIHSLVMDHLSGGAQTVRIVSRSAGQQVILRDMTVRHSSTSGTEIIYDSGAGLAEDEVLLERVLIEGTGGDQGFRNTGNSREFAHRIVNCVFFNLGTGMDLGISSTNRVTRAWNNTLVACSTGMVVRHRAHFVNNAFANNTADLLIQNDGSVADFYDCAFETQTDTGGWDPSNIFGINSAVEFRNEAGGDFRLASAAQCRNAGRVVALNSDRENFPRPVEGLFDIGAYEFDPAATPTVTRTLSLSPSFSPSATSTVSASPTRSPTPTRSPSPSPTGSRTATPSASPTPSISPSPSASPTPTASPTPSNSPTPSASPTPSRSPTLSASPTPTNSPSPSASPTPSVSPSPSASPTSSVSPSATATPSASPTPSYSATQTPTATLTLTLTSTATPTQTFTQTATASITTSFTASSTFTHTPQLSPTPTSGAVSVTLRIYDSAGNLLRVASAGAAASLVGALSFGQEPWDPSTGAQSVSDGAWSGSYDGKDSNGDFLASGSYLMEVESQSGSVSQKSAKSFTVIRSPSNLKNGMVWPNPAGKGLRQVSFAWTPASQEVDGQIYNQIGELVLGLGRLRGGQGRWELKDAASGVYFIALKIPGERRPFLIKVALAR